MSTRADRALWRVIVPSILLGAALGIAAGVALGWLVWPVRWYDTDPSDLRLGHQIHYVVMAADSYATTGDLETAQLRLYELMDDDTSRAQVANLVERVAVSMETDGDADSAQRIRRLRDDAGLPSPAEEEFVSGVARPMGSGVWIGLGVLGAAALLAALWLVGATERVVAEGAMGDAAPWLDGLPPHEAAPAPAAAPGLGGAVEEGDGSEDGVEPVPSVVLDAEGEEAAAPAPPAEAEEGSYEDEADWGEDAWEDDEDAWEEVEEPVLDAGERVTSVDELSAEEDTSPDRAGGEDAGPGDVLGTFEAEYRQGDADFDCSFSIESPAGAFLGECGVGVADVLRAADTRHVEAFEVWLFDRTDIRTVSAVLVSEGAGDDPDLREEVADKGKVLVAAPGLTVVLETLSLRVTATVRSCAFTDDGGEPRAYFEHLHVELVAEPNDGAEESAQGTP